MLDAASLSDECMLYAREGTTPFPHIYDVELRYNTMGAMPF